MAIKRYRGTVSTNKVGSECHFEFEIDEDSLPDDLGERREVIEKEAQAAMWESGQVSWDFEEAE
jgi:hypothetical protein